MRPWLPLLHLISFSYSPPIINQLSSFLSPVLCYGESYLHITLLESHRMPSSISGNERDQGEKERSEGGAIDEIEEGHDEVVTTQPRATSELREWNSGLFHCHKDIRNCIFVACCPICAAGYELYKHDENPVLGCCFTEVLMAFVSQYRSRNKIRGSLCTDFLASMFCGPCALCRLHRDYQELGH